MRMRTSVKNADGDVITTITTDHDSGSFTPFVGNDELNALLKQFEEQGVAVRSGRKITTRSGMVRAGVVDTLPLCDRSVAAAAFRIVELGYEVEELE